MQDTEFTIEEVNGVPTLYFLQIRDGKRSAKAESVIAYNLVKEGILMKEEAICKVNPERFEELLFPQIEPKDRKAATKIATGSAASPGAACGKVCFTQDEALAAKANMSKDPVLRRENRIKTIHSSLAIEHNSLSLEQVTDVIDGKHVWGPPQEIREVQNAYQAYEQLSDLDPYNINNLLYAHKLMMDGLVKEAGAFRKGNVGVYADDKLVHPGSPAKLVPELMHQLMNWLKKSKYHPLVKSCIFHYEFEFIHPFADGNGRTGRLWQSLILRQWKDIFAWLPVETLVHRNQQAYYEVLHQSKLVGYSTQFVTFMLTMIRDALLDLHHAQMHDDNSDVVTNVALNVVTNEDKLLALLKQDGSLTAKEMAASLNITYRQVQRIIAKLKDDNKLIRHGANKNGYWEVTGS